MKTLLALTALVVVSSAASVSLEDVDFDAWKLKFGKSYGSAEEESLRKTAWMNNLKLVLEHNKLADQGIRSYRLGMNHFADLSNQEFREMFSGCLKVFNSTYMDSSADSFIEPEDDDVDVLSKGVDWRKKGYVTAVKNQMACGSCWAFSATGALEGQMFRKTKKLVSLSEQQLVDCATSTGNNGCNGGWPARAYKYIRRAGGLEAEDSYPYEARDEVCRFKKHKVVATCKRPVTLPNGREKALQRTLARVGPISVAINAGRETFQLYKSGVYDDPYCSKSLNHAVLAVGYGRERGKDYWLVKNSWGVTWGDRGYIKMSRNKWNQCGIASAAVYPKV